jgi:hypothetical protein
MITQEEIEQLKKKLEIETAIASYLYEQFNRATQLCESIEEDLADAERRFRDGLPDERNPFDDDVVEDIPF